MTNFQEFLEFFKRQGVALDVFQGDYEGREVTYLSVSQAHFLFTETGSFLGVLADEMGTFEPKQFVRKG